MHRHSSHSTTIFAILHKASTTCFGNFWFGHHQVRYSYRWKYIYNAIQNHNYQFLR